MPKLYLGLGLILLLGLAFWYHGKSLDARYAAGVEAGVNTEKVKWQTVLLDSQAKAETEKQRLENLIRLERKSWETRINGLKKLTTDCMPPGVLNILRDAGIYTGPIPCK